jgi:hypothetical protein
MLNRVNITFESKLDPSIYTFDKVVEYLQRKTGNPSDSMILIDTIKNVALKDEIVSAFIGPIFNRNKNSKLDRLCEKISKINSSRLGITKIRPATVYWKHEKECKCDYCFDALKGECDECGAEKPTSPPKKFHKEFFDKVAENERDPSKAKKKSKKNEGGRVKK